MSEDNKTILYDFHVNNGARMVPFAGWQMPVQYTGILEEHLAVRESAGLFDVSHMGECRVKGAQSAEFLDYVCTNSIANLKNGQARYTLLCQEDGGCVDDIIVYRVSENEFFICLNAANAAKDIAWLSQHNEAYDCTVSDECEQWAQLALQGPKAFDILKKVTDVAVAEMGTFTFAEGEVAGKSCLISRTGYTGEIGVELYLKPEDAQTVAEALVEAGKAEGLKLCGLGSRDSLRLEAGYPLYGHEISESLNPLQGGMGWAVKFKKASDFIGKAALANEKEKGVSRKVIFFKLADKRIARPGTPVVSGGETVGEVVSGTHSPSLGSPIGSAWVNTANLEDSLAVSIRGKDYPLETVRPPFIKTSLTS